MRLNIGAGAEKMDGWKTLDIDETNDPDYCCHAYDLSMIGDWTVDEIRAVDVLEHLPYRKTGQALTEWHRVLKPGCSAYIQVPDAGTVMRWWVNRDARLLDRLPDDVPRSFMGGVNWRLMGGQDGRYGKPGFNAHLTLFSSASLTDAVRAAGFHLQDVDVNRHPNLCFWVLK